MKYTEWVEQRSRWLDQYPLRPLEERHLRLDIELSHPCDKLSDIPVDFNPHGGYIDFIDIVAMQRGRTARLKYDARECFYVCDDWSVIFDVCTINDLGVDSNLRMLVESSHKEPWGERIRLMSTSCSIVHEWWADRQNWHDFAFFRGKFWKIVWNEYFGSWPGGIVRGLPFQDRRHYDDPVIDHYDPVIDKDD